MTAKWEKYLKKIRNEVGTQEAFLQSITNFINHLINNVQETFQNSDIKTHVKEISTDKAIGKCPICQKELIDKGKFYGCTGYKEGCKFSLPKKWSSKTLTKKNISYLLTKKETTTIKGFKNKKGTSFNAKLQLKDNKLEFIFDNKK